VHFTPLAAQHERTPPLFVPATDRLILLVAKYCAQWLTAAEPEWEATGVQTSHGERVSAIISAVQIAGGIALTMAGRMPGSRRIEDQWRAASSGEKKGTPWK